MANNFVANPGAGGDTFAADDIGTYKIPYSKLDIGGAGVSSPVTSANPLPVSIATMPSTPVTGTFWQATQPVSGTLAATQSGAWSHRTQDGAGTAITSIADGAGQVGLTTAIGATNFVASAVNSSTAQLAASATFTGTIENIFNQQAISVLLTSDQNGTLTLNQYIDAAGTRKISAWAFSVSAGVAFSRCFVGNGNFFNLTFQNTGGSTTTTLNINTAYGTLPAATNLGNQPIAFNEVNGAAFSLGQAAMASSLPVSIASNQSNVPIIPPAAVLSSYNVAGVITINTILLTLDCSQYRSVSIQCTSMGTTGVVTPEWSNDNATWVAGTILTQAGATAATFNAAGLWVTPVYARYLRLRLSTATTGGTTTLSVHQFNDLRQMWLATQPVSLATNTPTLAAGTNLAADVGVQYRANATGAASVVSVLSPVTPAVATIKGSAGRLLGWTLQNSAAAVRSVKVFNATAPTLGTTAAIFEIDIAAGATVFFELAGGIGFSTAMTWSCTSAKGLTDNTATGLAANDVSGAFFFA